MRSFWRSHFLTLSLVALDMIALSLLWGAAWAIYGNFKVLNPWEFYQSALRVLMIVWIAILIIFKQYAHQGKISSLNQVGDIVKAGGALLIGTLATSHMLKGYDLSIAVTYIAPALITIYLYLSRTALRFSKDWLRKRGHNLTRVAIIGLGETARRAALRIQNHPEVGYELVGFIAHDCAQEGGAVATPFIDVPVIGDTTKLADLLLRYRVEEVFLAIPTLSHNEAFSLVLECEAANVQFKILKNDLLTVLRQRVKIDDIGDFPVIELGQGRLRPVEAALKRGLDLAVTIPMLLLGWPVFALIALLIRLDSPGPVLFAHERVGQHGKIFRLYKFRTMHVDVNPYSVAPGTQSDPRVTRFGRFLRRTSLDELPQFWNVLRGDMSLVGPRPEMPFIVAQYEPWQRRRLDVPQGLTGLWQIAGRKQLPLHFNLEYDFYYIRNWTILLDIVILVRTLPAVLFCKGAF